MPNPWSKARLGEGISRLASGFRSKRAGSLPVQTGFPTSLADLVVKNRTRLKKRRKPFSPDLEATVPVPPRDPDSVPVSALRSPSDAGDRSVAAQPITPVAGEGKRRGLGSGFPVAVVVVLLVALAIGGKWLVMGSIASAFGLWLLELAGFRVLAFLKPCEDAEKNLSSMFAGLDWSGREMISPITEVGDSEDRSDTLESVERRDFVDLERDSEVNRGLGSDRIAEKGGFDGVGGACEINQEMGSSKNVKAKKFFRKIFRKKSRGAKGGKDGKELVLSPREGDEDTCVEEVLSVGASYGASSIGSEEFDTISKASDGTSKLGGEELDVIQDTELEKASLGSENVDILREDVGVKRLGRSGKLVFLAVVLSGLVGGKVVAVLLTVACFLAIKIIDAISRKSKRY